jgi:osmotically-inducible protein OsmY
VDGCTGNSVSLLLTRIPSVVLHGGTYTVASQSVAEDAVQIAKTTKGVKVVHSYIEAKKEG